MIKTFKSVRHPGEVLKTDFLSPRGVTVYQAAKDCGIPQPTLQLIVSGKRSISAETALRLAVYFKGTNPEFWMNLQARYDLTIAKKKIEGRLKSIKPVETGATK